jgi:hypothetical protein
MNTVYYNLAKCDVPLGVLLIGSILDNVSVFELQLMQSIGRNLAIWRIETKYLKMSKALIFVLSEFMKN